jgi:hypothetical protein
VSSLLLVQPILQVLLFQAHCQPLAPSHGDDNIFLNYVLFFISSNCRSRINGDVGGRTQMASFVCSAVILLATFFLLPWLYYLPKCVLAVM